MNNDRFKFRVWDGKVSKKYFYLELKFGDNGYNPDFITDPVFEQCTGLKDKNGNLIYEGDLLGGLPIVWVNELNGFRVKVNTIHGWDWHYVNEFTNREITGNIHEQAEQKDK